MIPMPAKLRSPSTDWWAVTDNGVPVWVFPPNRRDLAERRPTRHESGTYVRFTEAGAAHFA